MLMSIKCSAVTSVAVHLTFDDNTSKHAIIGEGDLIDVEYNANGVRKRIEGAVIKVSAVGTDPNGWYIIVDGSDDFASTKAKFSPMSILDVNILRKADTLALIKTPIGDSGIPYLRLVHGRLQYSKDGCNWRPIHIDRRDIIEDQEGTVPIMPPVHHVDNGCGCGDTNVSSDDGIEDAVY